MAPMGVDKGVQHLPRLLALGTRRMVGTQGERGLEQELYKLSSDHRDCEIHAAVMSRKVGPGCLEKLCS